MSGVPVKALLWDNDGVLVDTEPLYFRATKEVLAGVGVQLTEELYIEVSLRRGKSLFQIADIGEGEAFEKLRAERNVRYQKLVSSDVPICDGAVECLEALHGRVPMAIVTSSLRPAFDAIHQQTGFMKYFEFALTNGDYIFSKPHPEPYLNAAKRLGVAPEQCVVVEDSERGLESATRAGMRCLVVPNRLTRSFPFENALAVLESARDIPGLVEPLLA